MKKFIGKTVYYRPRYIEEMLSGKVVAVTKLVSLMDTKKTITFFTLDNGNRVSASECYVSSPMD